MEKLEQKRKGYHIVIKYFLMYLGTIIVFAFIYLNMSYSFYHSTLTNEKTYILFEQKVLNELKKEVVLDLKTRHNEGVLYLDKNNKFYPLIDSITFTETTFDESPSFTFYIEIVNNEDISKQLDIEKTNMAFRVYTLMYNFKLNNTMVPLENNDILLFGDISLIRDNYDENSKINVGEEINIKKLFSSKNNKDCFIKVSKLTREKLWSIFYAKDGFTTNLEGNKARMLYLSIVTITTLGFGDIVPLTDAARLMVGLEAIIGIIIIGLFVNALFENRSKK